MKKFTAPLALALAVVMLAGPLVSAAQAMEPFAKPDKVTEADRRRNFRPGRRPPPRPAPRPAPRRSSGAPAVAGAIFGLALGGIIAGAIADSREPDVVYVAPTPPPAPVQVVPVVPQQQLVQVCDQYGNCWYEYR